MNKTKRRALYILAALLGALFILACLAGFAACGGGDDGNNNNNNDDQKKEEVVPGGDSGNEDACADGHTLVKTEAKSATCTEAGNNAYWTCSVCNKVFSDEAGTTETTVAAQTIPATGHTLVKTEAKSATCTEAGNNAYWTCSECNKVFSDEAGTTETSVEQQTIGKLSSDGKHTVVGTYADGSWTYTCSQCTETIDFENDPVASLTLEATDYASLSAAGAWNEATLDGVTPLINVTADISMTNDVDIKDCAKDMVLNADITVSSGWTLNVYTDMTLDLNGHGISVSDTAYDYYVVQVGSASAYGNLTVKDSSTTQTGKISSVGKYVIGVIGAANNDGKTSVFTLEGGTIESTNSGNGYVIYTSADASYGAEVINIKGGKVASTGGQAIDLNSGTLNVSDGTISGKYGVAVFGLASSNKSVTVNVTGGTIDGTAYGITTNGTSTYGAEVINVSGGTVTGGLVGIFFTNGSLTVSGGAISGATGIEIRGGSLTISNSTVTATGSTASVDWANNENNGAISSGYAIANTHTSSYKDASVTIGENVTMTGEVYTIVFNEAQLDWAVALNEVSIILGADIELSDTLEVSTTVTLDLNGFTLSCDSDHTISVTSTGNLTVIDSSDDASGKVDATAANSAALFNEGEVTLKGGTFTRSSETDAEGGATNSWYTVVNHGTMTIEDGTTIFNAGSGSSNLENGWESGGDASKSATLTINGGTICGGRYAVKNDSCGTLTINGGTIGGARSESDAEAYSALLNVNVAYIYGGKLVAGNGGYAVYNYPGTVAYESGSVTIGKADGAGPEIVYESNSNSTGVTYAYAVLNTAGGTVTIQGGSITTTAESGALAIGVYAYGGETTISGGTITATASGNGDAEGVYVDESGQVTISGGTITATGSTESAGIYVLTGTVTISGGTISCSAYSVQVFGDPYTGKVTITGGTFSGGIDAWQNADSSVDPITISDDVKSENGFTLSETDTDYGKHYVYTQSSGTEPGD